MPFALWTASQKRGLVVVFAVVLIALAIESFAHRQFVPDPQPPHGSHFDDLQDRLDPNTADLFTLSALPMLGEKRAAAIIAYRDQYTAGHPNGVAFPTSESLMAVRGIGPAMLDDVRPYLTFPASSRTQATPGSGSVRGQVEKTPSRQSPSR